ncbi:hypothetical protein PYW07_012493 [Mythimna separata]|uniref:DUF4795 domain-containing protein n=1 Tax=Mythimna separata TaxID=271217 RepID=A0AAD8DSW6_MYTSE|nr:hypothetical protein PYW07_012493 [Mythimna separata]
MNKRYRNINYDEPTMSDLTIIVSVEDLIYRTFGFEKTNVVNFKLLQTILHILARQLRLLEQDVEIKFDDLGIDFETGKSIYGSDSDDYSGSSEYSAFSDGKGSDDSGSDSGGDGASGGKGAKKGKGKKKDEKERDEKGKKKSRREKGEKEEREKRSKDRKPRSKDRRSPSAPDDEEGKGRDGRGRRRGGRGKRGEDDEELDGRGKRRGGRKRGEKDGDDEDERGRGGKRHGKRRKRGEDDEDEGGERDSHGKRRSGRRRRGEDDGDEGGEREGRHHSKRRRKGDQEGDEDGARGGHHKRRHGGGADDADDGGRHRHRRRVSHSLTSVTVSEETRDGGTVLIAERGAATRRVARVGSIEVVTASQFAMLERAVQQLEQVTAPMPDPSLPGNDQLREDVLQGRASLADTMAAVQLHARVKAAEQGLSRMAGLLTQLTAAGALPKGFGSRIRLIQEELQKSAAMSAGQLASLPISYGEALSPESEDVTDGDKESAGGADKSKRSPTQGDDWGVSTPKKQTTGEEAEAESVAYDDLPVTRNEMAEVLEQMKAALNKEIAQMTARANHSADIASSTTRNVSEKLAIALAIDDRITQLYSQTADYAVQLDGFDTGLMTQMSSFKEQMTMMRGDLKDGLEMLETANNNAETAAVQDLTERYEMLMLELESRTHQAGNLDHAQQQIAEEFKTLVECVEMLQEQKNDRDEVLDGLKDKADLSRLAGLLHETDFAKARFEIEKRIAKSYEKFYSQDEMWQIAMRDLTRITEHKADLCALMAFKQRATNEINEIRKKQHELEVLLGEPQAALLTRELAKGASCGVCLTRALMPMEDATYGRPALLPALRPAPVGAEDPCLADAVLRPTDTRYVPLCVPHAPWCRWRTPRTAARRCCPRCARHRWAPRTRAWPTPCYARPTPGMCPCVMCVPHARAHADGGRHVRPPGAAARAAPGTGGRRGPVPGRRRATPHRHQVCAPVCASRAVVPLEDATYGRPALLPALRPAPVGAEDPCLADAVLRPTDTRYVPLCVPHAPWCRWRTPRTAARRCCPRCARHRWAPRTRAWPTPCYALPTPGMFPCGQAGCWHACRLP